MRDSLNIIVSLLMHLKREKIYEVETDVALKQRLRVVKVSSNIFQVIPLSECQEHSRE
jgi:hypothetical protein